MMSGQTERDFALKAVALGAYDFYQKPIALDEIQLIVGRDQRPFEPEQENRKLDQRQAEAPLPGLVPPKPNSPPTSIGQRPGREREGKDCESPVGRDTTN